MRMLFLLRLCFNPCFNGSVERGVSFRRYDSFFKVSILVLMEVLREEWRKVRGQTGQALFQSLF